MSDQQISLDKFDKRSLTRGKPIAVEALWVLIRSFIFMSPLPWPSRLKAHLLRSFGAQVGLSTYIRPRLYIHFPWKLTLGDFVWIGEGCTLLNLEPLKIGDHSALGHEVYISTGSHDTSSPTMAYANASTTIERYCWIATRAFVGAGVSISDGVVIAAGSVVVSDIPSWVVAGGVPATTLKQRKVTPAQPVVAS